MYTNAFIMYYRVCVVLYFIFCATNTFFPGESSYFGGGWVTFGWAGTNPLSPHVIMGSSYVFSSYDRVFRNEKIP